MCIIVYKPEGIKIDIEFINNMKNCYDENHDGCGYMYPENGKVHIRKGFMTWNVIEKELRKFLYKDIPFVVHFRLATHGNIDRYTCHPFPISSKVEDLKSVKISCPVGLAHNGIITFCATKNSVLSDTQIFIKEYLSEFPLDTLKKPAFHDLIEEATKDKFVLMFPDKVILIGNFIKDKGIYYSNNSYINKRQIFFKRITWKKSAKYDNDTCDLCNCNGKLHEVIDYVSYEKLKICDICFQDFYFTCSVCQEVLPIEYESTEEDEVCAICYEYLNKY